MSKVVALMSMSLAGYVADANAARASRAPTDSCVRSSYAIRVEPVASASRDGWKPP
jgi:hypothetical protein